jgi:hypothetical protein
LAEDRSDSPADQQRKLESAQDAEVEELTRRLAAVVNGAAAEGRQGLRDYAIGLLKEETELAEAPPTPPEATHATRFNPLAIALLLVLASLPLFLSIVFAPVGLALLGLAALMGIWGLLASVFERRSR